MNLIIIFGPGACGKMTVGQELSKLTGYRLFHNHMTIEPILEIFGSFNKDILQKFRDICFDEFCKGNYPGLIFTVMWAFDCDEDNRLIDDLYKQFINANHQIYFVELYAPLDVRLERNKTENRIINKPSKRNLEISEKRLLKTEEGHRFNSELGEVKYPNYIRIDNTSLGPDNVVNIIKERFNLI